MRPNSRNRGSHVRSTLSSTRYLRARAGGGSAAGQPLQLAGGSGGRRRGGEGALARDGHPLDRLVDARCAERQELRRRAFASDIRDGPLPPHCVSAALSAARAASEPRTASFLAVVAPPTLSTLRRDAVNIGARSSLPTHKAPAQSHNWRYAAGAAAQRRAPRGRTATRPQHRQLGTHRSPSGACAISCSVAPARCDLPAVLRNPPPAGGPRSARSAAAGARPPRRTPRRGGTRSSSGASSLSARVAIVQQRFAVTEASENLAIEQQQAITSTVIS